MSRHPLDVMNALITAVEQAEVPPAPTVMVEFLQARAKISSNLTYLAPEVVNRSCFACMEEVLRHNHRHYSKSLSANLGSIIRGESCPAVKEEESMSPHPPAREA